MKALTARALFCLGFSFLAFSARAQTPPPEASLPGAACATAHPLATRACLHMLEQGGNAIDAAVAASAALAVVEPTGSGLGGGGFWLVHNAADQTDVFIDGRETAPAAARADMYLDANGQADPWRARNGALAAGIPGEPAALVHLSERYGQLPLARALQPAIDYARDGFAVDAKLARAIVQHQSRFSAEAARIFAPNGTPLNEGQTLQQSDLAATLQALAARGVAGFYQGEVAQKLVDGARQNGGIWTLDDLRGYRIVERAPVVTQFRDYRIISAPLPSAGGIAMAQVFQQLEVLGFKDDASALRQHQLIETLRRAYRDRAAWLGDSDFVRVPVTELSARSYAIELASSINLTRATASRELPPATPSGEGTNTTHLSVIDAQGNRVAATLSINLPFGSGTVAAGTGVLLNDEMDDFSSQVGAANAYGLVGSAPNAIAPHKRPLSSMSPTFVEGPRGILVIGTPGGSRIITMVIQGVLNWINGDALSQVVSAPRLHHQYLPDVVQLEPDTLTQPARAQLAQMGHTLQTEENPWGNMQAVSWEPQNGGLHAASDPRGVGQGVVIYRTALADVP
ncbi:gamma-glutamyltransferase [Sinimarinibacterium sp. NLF-5-8]|uniref:gamma-glutamyltransferase n=1 Tax=Sinimarinibacterium sp. NLF-5-8 TaxID=2698684 RepID=UPI00137C19FD|nr:gamma-glutamyltransferase [Sinimarinibacterium sp. NLF-5-8]QHS09291.1 gamma-glutamyltransferase [Sinimarinibacterium sp. NLF-5-8]